MKNKEETVSELNEIYYLLICFKLGAEECVFKKKQKTARLDFRNVQYDFNHCLEMLFCL